MMMDRAEMRKIQVALGKWFARSRVGDFGFEIVEIALIAQIQLVNEDRRGKALAAGFRGTLFHGRLQSNTFNRTDFRKAGTAKHEARFAVLSGRALLLWHVRNLSHIFRLAMPSG
jgi:hypothetical protein